MALQQLPQDPDTERTLLSTLCAPGAERAAQECSAVLRAEDFFTPAHRQVFTALGTVLDEGGELNSLSLRDALERSKALPRVGGLSGLHDILGAEEVSRPMALVEILMRYRRRRDLIILGSNISRQALDGADLPEAITEAAGAELTRISMRQDHGRIRHIAEVSDQALSGLSNEMNGIRTDRAWVKKWSRLNGMLGGFHPGQLIVLAARPGVGKTALALNWVLGVSEYGKTVGIFSLEMAADALWRRLAAAHAGVDLRAMVANKDAAAFQKMRRAKEELDARGIWIQDRAAITAREIQGEVDGLLARQPRLGLLVVDHLSLVSSQETANASRQTEATRIGTITRAFKLLAKDRKIPVLLLAQLNREVEARTGGKPKLSDLRDSGCVEQDADVVLFIHRPGKDPKDRSACLVVGKQREGPTGEIGMDWDGPITRFKEVEQMTKSAKGEWDEQEEWV